MRVGVLAAMAAVAALPAVAGEMRPALDLSAMPPAGSADRGKAVIFTPPPLVSAPQRCLPPLPCGARIVGAIEKNGAVELQVPAWRW